MCCKGEPGAEDYPMTDDSVSCCDYHHSMPERNDEQQTIEDALATRVEDRRGAESPWAVALRELGAVDRAVYQAVAVTPTPHLDDVFRRLSNAANYSRLWLGMAAAIATFGGRRGRRVAQPPA